MTTRCILMLLLPVLLCAAGKSFPQKPNLIIRFEAMADGGPLIYNKNYLNSLRQTYRIERFRFYGSRFTAGKPDGDSAMDETAARYYLIDFSDSPSTQIMLHLKAGIYTQLRFQLGVDSIDQTSGAKSGALDPAKGMFWTWNTGYVSIKLEGTSPSSTQPGHSFAYHLGGYRFPNETIETVSLSLPTSQTFTITDQSTMILNIPLDLNQFFDTIDIPRIPVCAAPGELAKELFHTFSTIFKAPGPVLKPKS